MSQTVVFVHGAFCSPACWAPWIAWFEAKGWTCVAPAWPHNEGPVEQLRSNPDPALAGVGVAEIVARYADVIRGLDAPPALIGHSFGGLFVQLLLAQGLGAAGVAIHPAPPKGINPTPQAIKANFPVLSKWGAHKKLHTMSFEDYKATFDNDRDESAQRATYDKLIVPTPGRPFVQAGTAPFHGVTKVDWTARTAPLLIMAGGNDLQVPAAMNQANYRKYDKSDAVTEFELYPDRTHMTIGAPGWEDVAQRALDFPTEHGG